jgi:hypothetical protein
MCMCTMGSYDTLNCALISWTFLQEARKKCQLTNSLTSWSRVFEKIIVAQLVNKFPAFMERSSLPFSQEPILSQLNPVHTSYHTSLQSIFILSSHPSVGIQSGVFPSNFPINRFICISYIPNACYMPNTFYPPGFFHLIF